MTVIGDEELCLSGDQEELVLWWSGSYFLGNQVFFNTRKVSGVLLAAYSEKRAQSYRLTVKNRKIFLKNRKLSKNRIFTGSSSSARK